MPEAHGAYAEAAARVSRTIYEHAHYFEDVGNVDFPPMVYTGRVVVVLLHLPDNWNGTDEFYLKFLNNQEQDETVDITIDVGTCDEAPNTHTQTVNAINVNTAINIYKCLDLMTTFATIIALLNPDDNIRIKITTEQELSMRCYGAVMGET